MKKIYSCVLMAAMLLISTNAWATTITLGDKTVNPSVDYDHLRDAFLNASNGDVIELVTSLSDGTQSWFGEASATGASRAITLDLKGNTYTYTGAGNAISFTRGKLEIISTGKKGTITTAQAIDIIRVYGTYQKIDPINSTPFTHLVIAQNVEVLGTVEGCNAVTVDVLRKGEASKLGYTAATYPMDYSCNFYEKISGGGHGVANGVRLDIYGSLTSKKYALKVNGCIRLGKEFLDENGDPKTTKGGKQVANPYYEQTTATPVKYFEPYYNGGANSGSYAITNDDANYSPYVYIANSARLVTNNPTATNSIAAYSSGYARWQIEGYCEGSTGVYVKSGEVVLNDATVTSNYEGDYVPAGREGTDRASGVDAGGSGVVVESSANYSGDIAVTVEGDTEVSGTSGYAIDENVTAADNETNVNAITITGGSFEGGDQGTIRITDVTADAAENPGENTTIEITGGTVTGTGENNVNIGGKNLEDYLSGATGTTHITYVDNGSGGQTMVISEGTAPVSQTNLSDVVTAYTTWVNGGKEGPAPSVKVTGTLGELNQDMELTELEMNEATDQVLTINTGNTLTVGRVVLGQNAQIVVKAGAELVVTGAQGISAPSNENIILENTETTQATFLIHPEVSNNRRPHATVNMKVAKAGKDGSDYAWHRFAMPVEELKAAWGKSPNYGTYLYGWDYMADDWAALAGGSTDMVPWQGYTLSYNEPYNEEEIVTYTFKGQLLGNINAGLEFQAEGFNFFGNSYTGYIDALTLVEGLAGSRVRGTIYMWSEDNQLYSAVSLDNLRNHRDRLEDFEKEVASMQTFILQLAGANYANQSVNYASAVWGNPRYGNASPAPARRAEENYDEDYMKIIVTAENGNRDFVTFTKNSNLSDAYEDGYDAVKYMNANRVNMYSTVDGQDYASVASDNLIGKKLSINTGNDVNYTMSFKFVEGVEYAIKDNLTNKVTPIAEGNIYTFAAQPNTKIDGRFEIVGLETITTAIDNTEVNNEVRGIYTLLGQYVGEDFNALPAGVYIVNGVKVVK